MQQTNINLQICEWLHLSQCKTDVLDALGALLDDGCKNTYAVEKLLTTVRSLHEMETNLFDSI